MEQRRQNGFEKDQQRHELWKRKWETIMKRIMETLLLKLNN